MARRAARGSAGAPKADTAFTAALSNVASLETVTIKPSETGALYRVAEGFVDISNVQEVVRDARADSRTDDWPATERAASAWHT
jgi:hypothetical protein